MPEREDLNVFTFERINVNSDSIRELEKAKLFEDSNFSIDAPFKANLMFHGPKAVVSGKEPELTHCNDKELQYSKCLDIKKNVKIIVYKNVRLHRKRS